MLWPVALTVLPAAGWFVARTPTAGARQGPRWATALVELSLGALASAPVWRSVLYFLALAAARRSKPGRRHRLVGRIAGCRLRIVVETHTGHRAAPDANPKRQFPYLWALWIAVAVGLRLFLWIFRLRRACQSGRRAGRHAVDLESTGARSPASGAISWRRAVSSELGGHITATAHPGYPLFLSGFIAIQWSVAGGFDDIVPITVSLLFALGPLILLGASLARAESRSRWACWHRLVY